MSQREYAVELINVLSDEQVSALVGFITRFADINTVQRVKEAERASEIENNLQLLSSIKEIIRSVPVEEEKEAKAEYPERKYGIESID